MYNFIVCKYVECNFVADVNNMLYSTLLCVCARVRARARACVCEHAVFWPTTNESAKYKALLFGMCAVVRQPSTETSLAVYVGLAVTVSVFIAVLIVVIILLRWKCQPVYTTSMRGIVFSTGMQFLVKLSIVCQKNLEIRLFATSNVLD